MFNKNTFWIKREKWIGIGGKKIVNLLEDLGRRVEGSATLYKLDEKTDELIRLNKITSTGCILVGHEGTSNSFKLLPIQKNDGCSKVMQKLEKGISSKENNESE